MLRRLFTRSKTANRLLVDAVYGEIVAAARRPVMYAEWDVPDTPLGRFEMVALHLILLLHRLRGASEGGRDMAQELIDEFFKDIEHSIRELGIGDMGVPKRMKKLARMFYGRVASYDEALDLRDAELLAGALRRNVRPDESDWPQANLLAVHVLAAAASLASRSEAEIADTAFRFPTSAGGASGKAAA